jgi:hypothetical protein
MMRERVLSSLSILSILVGLLSIVRPTSAIDGSTPPPPPTTQPMPQEVDVPYTPPSPHDFLPRREEARLRRAAQAVLAKYVGFDRSSSNAEITEVRLEGDWAVVVAQSADQASPIYLLGQRETSGRWQVLPPDQDGLYLRWLTELSDSLLAPALRADLRDRILEQPTADDAYRLVARREAGQSVIYLVDEAGTEHAIATEPADALWLPMFERFITRSPDMRYVAYVTADDLGMQNAQMWLIDLQDDSQRRLASFPRHLWVAPLVWSPDSSHLAFTKVASSQQSNQAIELWTIDVDSEEQSLVVSAPSFRPELFYHSELPVFHWSSDGDRISYTDYVSEPGSEIVHQVDLSTGSTDTTRRSLDAEDQSSLSTLASLPCGVSQFSQNDPEWKDDVMQTCGLTIGAAGCALTSASMVFRYYDVATSPRTMNQCMGNYACPFYWSTAASSCSGGKVNWQGSYGFSWSTLESELTAGRPPIVQFDCGSYDHFVVVVSGSGTSSSGYTINDPWDGYVKSMSSYDGCSLQGMRLYSGTPWCQGDDCPTSGGVILYQNANYDCGGEGEGTGYVLRSSTGWQNVPSGFNDQASSLRVPSGWSVRLYEHGDRAGASVCRNSDDTDFAGDSYDGGTSLNDTVSSFEVFDSSDCGGGSGDTVTLFEHPDYWGTEYGWHDAGWYNVPDYMNDLASSIRIADGWSARVYQHSDLGGDHRCYNDDDNDFSDEGFDNVVSSIEIYHQENCPTAPSAPLLTSPGNGASLAHDADITLDWGSVGDATGYYAHLWGGPGIDINSGWIGVTDWHIGTQWPGTYQWQVKSRNDYGESGWSSTWSFTVEEEPQPDLRPYTPSGYPYPVVPSSETGTHDVGALYGAPGITTYFDWHFINSGRSTAPGTFYVELWVDDTRYVRYPQPNFGVGQVGGADDWAETISEPGWHTVRLEVDPDDNVQESNEGNNVWEQDFYWESTCGDGNELNNDPASATSIPYGETRSGYICPAGDEDFFAFAGQSGDRIVVDVDAFADGSALDPYVYLLDSDGTTVIEQNDDEASGRLDSHLHFDLPHDGTYYIKVRDYSHPDEGGGDYFYALHLLTDDFDPDAQIISPQGDTFLDPDSILIRVNADDAQSGISRVEFLWHDGNWGSSDWVWLGADWDGSDGWRFNWDTSSIPEQSNMAVYIWAFDWADNWVGDGAYGLILDRTPIYIPLVCRES